MQPCVQRTEEEGGHVLEWDPESFTQKELHKHKRARNSGTKQGPFSKVAACNDVWQEPETDGVGER